MSVEYVHYGKYYDNYSSRWESQEGTVDFEHWLRIKYDESVHITFIEKIIESESSQYRKDQVFEFDHPCTFKPSLFKEHQDEILEVSYTWLSQTSFTWLKPQSLYLEPRPRWESEWESEKDFLLSLYLKIAPYLNSSPYELIEYRFKSDDDLPRRSLHDSKYTLIIDREIAFGLTEYEVDRVEYRRVHYLFTEPTFIYYLGNYRCLEQPEQPEDEGEIFWRSLDPLSRANIENMIES